MAILDEIEIRLLRREDLFEGEIPKESGEESQEALRRVDAGQFLGALHKGKAIAFIAFREGGLGPRVERVFVDEGKRGQGVSRALLGHLQRLLLDQGHEEIWAIVWETDECLKWFGAVGFRELGHIAQLPVDEDADEVDISELVMMGAKGHYILRKSVRASCERAVPE